MRGKCLGLLLFLLIRLLLALEAEFSHCVPNSLVHTLTTVDKALHFYSARVDVRTPYEKMDDEAKK